MRGYVLAALGCGLAACHQPPAGETLRETDSTFMSDRVSGSRSQTGSRLLDTVGVLADDDAKAIAARLARGELATGRPVVVVTLVPQGGNSMEQVGWAISGDTVAKRTLLILVDPKQRVVRVEGQLAAEAKAAIASAMQSDLRGNRVAAAINRGLDRLEQVGS